MSNNKYQQLMSQLQVAPLHSVQGVVAASGIAYCKSQGETMWSMGFSLTVWCKVGGAIQHNELMVQRDVMEDEMDSYRNLIKPYAIVTLELGLIEDSDFDDSGRPQALLHRISPSVSLSPELTEVASTLQQPVTIEDAQFGTFTLDRWINRYEAHTSWSDFTIRLSLESSGDRDGDALPEAALRSARKLWTEVPRWNREARAIIVRELLALKNDDWLDNDEQPLTEAEFLSRLTLESITVANDGSFEFWFDDGDTFWGHAITVSGSLSQGMTDANISG